MALIPLAIAIISRFVSNVLVNIRYASRLVDTYGEEYVKYSKTVSYSSGEKIMILFLTAIIAGIAINKYLSKTQLGYTQTKKISIAKDKPDISFMLLSFFLGVSGAFFVAGSTLLFGKSAENIYSLDFSFKGIVKISLLILATYFGAKYKELAFRKSLPVIAETTNMPFILFNVIQATLFAILEMNFIAIIPNFCMGYLFAEYFSTYKDYKKTTTMHIIYALSTLGALLLAFNYTLTTPMLLIAAGIAGLFSVTVVFYFILSGEETFNGKEKIEKEE
jgi:hypothetical protein